MKFHYLVFPDKQKYLTQLKQLLSEVIGLNI